MSSRLQETFFPSTFRRHGDCIRFIIALPSPALQRRVPAVGLVLSHRIQRHLRATPFPAEAAPRFGKLKITSYSDIYPPLVIDPASRNEMIQADDLNKLSHARNDGAVQKSPVSAEDRSCLDPLPRPISCRKIDSVYLASGDYCILGKLSEEFVRDLTSDDMIEEDLIAKYALMRREE